MPNTKQADPKGRFSSDGIDRTRSATSPDASAAAGGRCRGRRRGGRLPLVAARARSARALSSGMDRLSELKAERMGQQRKRRTRSPKKR